MKFCQACYGKPGNNWELFNISPDAAPSMVSVLEKHEKSSTPENVGVENTINPDGTPKCFYEFISDEDAICLIRVQYGETDGFGRPKMFAHGFAFEGEGMLEDPSVLLSVDDSNFAFSVEATEKIPEKLLMSGNFSFDKCFSDLGLSRENFETLMACVHTSLASATDFPIYIKCDNNMQTVKNAIFCILSALPYQLRYHLSFSNANSFRYSRSKCVMFVDSVPAHEYYFDLATGETNISLTEINSDPDSYIAYYDFQQLGNADFAEYCKALKTVANNIGYPYNCYYEQLKMAITMLHGTSGVKDMTDVEVIKYLIELLSKIPYQNVFVDDYIAKVLETIDSRAMILNDAIMERLDNRCTNTASVNLVDVYKRIRIRVLLNSGTQNIVVFLAKQRTIGKTIFNEWRDLLSKIEGGRDAIVAFYRNLFLGCDNIDAVVERYREAREFGLGSDEMIVSTAKNHIATIAKTIVNPTKFRNTDFHAVMVQLSHSMREVCSATPDEAFKAVYADIQKTFWANFRYSDFDFCSVCYSNFKDIRSEKQSKSLVIAEFLKIFESVEHYKNNQRFAVVEKAFRDFSRAVSNETEAVSALAEPMREYICNALKSRDGDRHFVFWLKLASFGNRGGNALETLIKWDLSVVMNEEHFESAFNESEKMREIASIIYGLMVGDEETKGVVDIFENKPELSKMLKREAKLISDYLKQVSSDEKKREKEQKEREKEIKKRDKELEKREKEIEKSKKEPPKKEIWEEDSDETKKSGGFFSSLFGKKKK